MHRRAVDVRRGRQHGAQILVHHAGDLRLGAQRPHQRLPPGARTVRHPFLHIDGAAIVAAQEPGVASMFANTRQPAGLSAHGHWTMDGPRRDHKQEHVSDPKSPMFARRKGARITLEKLDEDHDGTTTEPHQTFVMMDNGPSARASA